MRAWQPRMTVNGMPVEFCNCRSNDPADPHWSVGDLATALGRPPTDADVIRVHIDVTLGHPDGPKTL